MFELTDQEKQLADRMVTRVLWHLASERPNYKTTIAAYGSTIDYDQSSTPLEARILTDLLEKDIGLVRQLNHEFGQHIHSYIHDLANVKPQELSSLATYLVDDLAVDELAMDHRAMYKLLEKETAEINRQQNLARS